MDQKIMNAMIEGNLEMTVKIGETLKTFDCGDGYCVFAANKKSDSVCDRCKCFDQLSNQDRQRIHSFFIFFLRNQDEIENML